MCDISDISDISDMCDMVPAGLLTREPERRLGKGGVTEIKTHPFFQHKGFKWQAIMDRAEAPPFDFGLSCRVVVVVEIVAVVVEK